MPLDSAVVGALRDACEGALSTDGADTAAVAHDLWPRALIRRRAGEVLAPPDCVVWPSTAEQVAAVLRTCAGAGVPVTPFGAGTGVCGAAMPVHGGVVLDLKRMDRIVGWDEESGYVVAQPGILGIRLEQACLDRGLTTGHYPSSLPCSTLGGFIATRSVGQLSTRYGRIDDIVAGMRVVLVDGAEVVLAPQPAAGAGPDLRRLFMGSEGQYGVIVEATLRLHPVAEHRADRALLFPGFPEGMAAVRRLMRAGLRPALLRLYDVADTAMQAEHLGVGEGRGSLLLLACEGRRGVAEAEAAAAEEMCRDAGAAVVDAGAVGAWYARRFDLGYRQAEYLPSAGVVLDTIEVAAPWSRLARVYDAVTAPLRDTAIVLCHLSHGYVDGACLYFTFGLLGEESDAVARHERLWEGVMRSVMAEGGTIAHHHGVGLARSPWLEGELGGGLEVLRRIKRALDPAGVANPGKWGLG